MSIVYFPSTLTISNPADCAICRVKLTFDKATAGLLDADQHQALACISHFSEVELLIMGWADFMARERRRYLKRQERLGGNAWTNS